MFKLLTADVRARSVNAHSIFITIISFYSTLIYVCKQKIILLSTIRLQYFYHCHLPLSHTHPPLLAELSP